MKLECIGRDACDLIKLSIQLRHTADAGNINGLAVGIAMRIDGDDARIGIRRASDVQRAFQDNAAIRVKTDVLIAEFQLIGLRDVENKSAQPCAVCAVFDLVGEISPAAG